jgi:glycosyltransferase involved in cell wall biosynthesis
MNERLAARLRRAPRVLLGLAAQRAGRVGVALLGGALVLGVALAERLPTELRRRRGARPRLAWGPVPLISLSYWSRALRALGYESQTVVTHHYRAYERSSFDAYGPDLLAGCRGAWLGNYRLMALMLRRADVFVSFFDGGFLGATPLWRLEAPAIRLAGKRLVVCPYGGDIAVPGHLGPFEAAFVADYPTTIERAPEVRRRVDWLCDHADLVIRNLQVGYLPRFDVVWPQQVAVDTDLWTGNGAASAADGRVGEVVVVHAPNHRALKATDALEAAVQQLRTEGLQVRLDLIQGRPNEEVRRSVRDGDIVAEQFIGGYALFAIEGMSAGRPVVSNLSWMAADLRAYLTDCPIVDATPETLADRLRTLVTDPELRRRLGREGREYALRVHSYAAVGERWAALFNDVWSARRPSTSRT